MKKDAGIERAGEFTEVAKDEAKTKNVDADVPLTVSDTEDNRSKKYGEAFSSGIFEMAKEPAAENDFFKNWSKDN